MPLRQFKYSLSKNIGIVSVSGFKYFTVIFAKAIGADKIVSILKKNSKKDNVLKISADKYIAIDNNAD